MTEYTLKQKEKKRLYEETLQLKRDIYKKYGVGGALHIVLEDVNVEDHHIEWCLKEIEQLPEDKELFLKCANNLLKMTKTQRKKLCYDC